MARYIDADILIERLKFKRDETDKVKKKYSGLECAISQVQKQPTADVVEVKHGHWIENDYRSFDGFETVVYPNEALKCSECSHNFKKELLWRKNYCPECGAKMDGERKCEDGKV